MKKDFIYNIGQSIVLTLLAVLCLILFGLSIFIYQHTIINIWIIIALTVAVTLISGFLAAFWLLSKFGSLKSAWKQLTCVLLLSCSIGMSGFLGLNYYFSTASSAHTESVEITRKYYETHHRSRRSGRRGYIQGPPYKVYFIEISFTNGQIKTLRLPYSQYKRIHKGDSIDINTEKGLFGYKVLKDNPF